MKHLVPVIVVCILIMGSLVTANLSWDGGDPNPGDTEWSDYPVKVSKTQTSNTEPTFTFTGLPTVVEGRRSEYTFYLEHNDECDRYEVWVYWWDDDMVPWVYPGHTGGVFYTGGNNTIEHTLYQRLGPFFMIAKGTLAKARAFCGNQTYEAELRVHIAKHPIEYDVYGLKHYTVKVTNNLEYLITFDVSFYKGWFTKEILLKMGSFPVEAFNYTTFSFDWPTNTIFLTTFEINSSIGESFIRRGLTLFGYNLYFPILDKRS